MITLTQEPPLAKAPYVVGYDGLSHAVRHACAAQVIEEHPEVLQRFVPTVCGKMVGLVIGWGDWRRDNPMVAIHPCHACAWTRAIEAGTVDGELEAMRPSGSELAALTRLVDDPFMAVRLCEAILRRADLAEDAGERERTVMLLAHVTAHAPALITPEDCQELSCGHERPAKDDPDAECYAEATAACHGCSAREGSYAGDQEGIYAPECTVLAPCDVIATSANHYGLKVGGNRGVR